MYNINYYSHVVLNSKYKILINFIIYLILYISITTITTEVTYCMVNESDSGSHSTIFKTQIEEFVQSAQTIETQSNLIEEQKQAISEHVINLKQLEEKLALTQLAEEELQELRKFKSDIIREIHKSKMDLGVLDFAVNHVKEDHEKLQRIWEVTEDIISYKRDKFWEKWNERR